MSFAKEAAPAESLCQAVSEQEAYKESQMRTKHAPAITWLTIAALLISMCASLAFSRNTNAQSAELEKQETDARAVLTRYTVDLTRLASQRQLEPVQGFDAEIARVITQLSGARAKAPIVVGESDADRGAIARGVAFRLLAGNAPENLRGKKVLSLSLDALAKDAKTSAQFEQRLQAVFTAAESSRNEVILFVDQLHQYAGARATAIATAAVKAAIENSHVFIIAGTSPEAYSSYIASDQRVANLFESITIDSSSEVAANAVSKDKRKSPIDEEFEGEKISADMRDLIESARSNGRIKTIVQVSDVNRRELAAFLKQNGIAIDGSMKQIGAVSVELPAKAVAELAAQPFTNYISPDVQLESFGHVTATTGTTQIRNAPGLIAGLLGASAINGDGVGIAILDSGMDSAHESFTANGTRIQFSKDFTGENNTSADPYGHGSHVAASAAAARYSDGDRYEGIAPGATLINLRVLNSQGAGTTSALLAALNWIISPADPTKAVSSTNPLNKNKYNIRIVNMSLGAPAVSSYKNDPICRAARALVDAGIVVVAAAGNNGKDSSGRKIYGQIHSPGAEPSVITVGAANTFATDSHADDGVATYSSRGPTRGSYTDANGVRHYDNLIKPDLIAPGNKLIYAESDGGSSGLLGTGLLGSPVTLNYLVTKYPSLDSGVTNNDNKRLMYHAGNSIGTPIVPCMSALMFQVNPKLTPNMVKMILMYTAQPLAGWNRLEQGTGE